VPDIPFGFALPGAQPPDPNDPQQMQQFMAQLQQLLATPGSERTPSFPDVPTFQEAGFKEMDVTGYFGLWFPARTPRARVDLINREAVKALQSPELRKVIAEAGLKAVGSSPDEFARFVQRDFEWQKAIVQRIGLQTE